MQMQVGKGISMVARVEFERKLADMLDMSKVTFKSWPIVNGRANGIPLTVLKDRAFQRRIQFNDEKNRFSIAR